MFPRYDRHEYFSLDVIDNIRSDLSSDWGKHLLHLNAEEAMICIDDYFQCSLIFIVTVLNVNKVLQKTCYHDTTFFGCFIILERFTNPLYMVNCSDIIYTVI